MIAVDRGDRRGDRTAPVALFCGPLVADLPRFETRSRNDEIPGVAGDLPSHRGFVGAGDRGVEPRVTVLETVAQGGASSVGTGDLDRARVPGDRRRDRTFSSLQQEDAMRDAPSTAPSISPVQQEGQGRDLPDSVWVCPVHGLVIATHDPSCPETIRRYALVHEQPTEAVSQ